MTAAMTGHPYAKAPLDIAVWDLAARAAALPLWQRLGGDGPEPTPLYRPVQGTTPDAAAATALARLDQGYRRLQVKVGDDPIVDAQRVLAVGAAVGDDIVIFADANCGFSLSAARRFVRELGADGAGIFLEQPCATLADCGRLRASWTGPMVMDETIVSLAALLEAHRLGVADGVTVKLTRVGGITPAITIRDVAVELGIGVTVEDSPGCNLADTTFAHERFHPRSAARARSTSTTGSLSPTSMGRLHGTARSSGRSPRRPASALELREDILGDPFLDVRA